MNEDVPWWVRPAWATDVDAWNRAVSEVLGLAPDPGYAALTERLVYMTRARVLFARLAFCDDPEPDGVSS